MEASTENSVSHKPIFVSNEENIPEMRRLNYDSESQSTLEYSEDFSNQSNFSYHKESSSSSFATILKLLELEDMANAFKTQDEGLLSHGSKYQDGVSNLSDQGDSQTSESPICSNSKSFIDSRDQAKVANIFQCMHENIFELIDCDW